MKTGSLCSGYGGLDLAVRAELGGELAWVADPDPGAAAILAHRFSSVPNLGDITAVDWSQVEPVDVLTAGYPCQPFSAAGRRKGAEDARHLWPHVAAAIGALRPGTVVLENVQGHLTLGFDIVLADLAALGYDAEWTVVTASAAGACHRRARVFILAFPARARTMVGVPAAVIRDGTWLEPEESLFGAVPFTGRVPASGSMAGGRIHAAEGAPAVMAAGLLKTPTAQLAVNGGSQHPDKRKAGGHGPTLADQVEHELLLPTPRPQTNGGGAAAEDPPNRQGGPNQRGSSGDLMLPSAVMQFLPTPSAADGTGGHKTRSGDRKDEALLGGIGLLLPTPRVTCQAGMEPSPATARGTHGTDLGPAIGALPPTPSAGNFNDGEDLASWEARRQRNLARGVNGNGQGTPLPVAAQQLAGAVDWGPYEPAIRRWEAVTGHPAPMPTVPGKTGQRLNPELVEWMQGLSEGWVTTVPGVSRNAQLKLLGNGVVPRQGALALRILLERMAVRDVRAA